MDSIKLLFAHNYCAKALFRKLDISEVAVSQHLKLLREAQLLIGEKRGYFIHYTVDRAVIHKLSQDIFELAQREQSLCSPKQGGCHSGKTHHCHIARYKSEKEER